MKVDKMVPQVYYKESRDFSYIGRIFEIVLNYLKTGADLVDNNIDSDQVNPLLIDLLAKTLGFESKHEYITKDLIAIAGTLIEILQYKGTIESIKMVVRALSAAQGISQELDVDVDPADKHDLILILPPNLKDIVLMKDLFDYILPVGTRVTYAKASTLTLSTENIGKYFKDDIAFIRKISSEETASIVGNDSRFIVDSNIVPESTPNKANLQENLHTGLTYFGTVFDNKEGN